MRNKIVMITAALAVMMALTGIAAATGIVVSPNPIVIDVNQEKIQSVTVTTNDNVAITNFQIIGFKDPDGISFTPSDKFTIKIDGVEAGNWTGTKSSGSTFIVSYTNNKNVLNGDYRIKYSANDVEEGEYVVTVKVTAIPEFPTVALPIAAVLGLVFFFQQRKIKKE